MSLTNVAKIDKPAAVQRGHITAEQVAHFHDRGYLIVKGLFAPSEVQTIQSFFDEMAEKATPIPGYWEPKLDSDPNDILQRYPRVLQPHRFDAMSLEMLLHPATHQVLKALLEEEPAACQSMFYFKPPGARGQALHQDNFYLEVLPKTCIAAWTAIDRADPENGGLYIVPNTQGLPLQCPKEADLSTSFTSHLVDAPKGFKAIPAEMDPGDTLFFNGNIIHGSGPNRSKDRWRRSFICHYMPASSKGISKYYHPVLDFDGQAVTYEVTDGGGPCGDVVKPASYNTVVG